MGKFEDLVQQAREGDAEALDELEKEFSGSNLREQQEAATQSLKENESFIREGKFRHLMAELGEDVVLSMEDLEGVDSQDFTANLLREKAEDKSERVAAVRLEAATSAGFDSVEEYDKALEELKAKQAEEKAGMEALGGATASTSGGQSPPTEVEEPYDEALKDFEGAKKGGATQDVAMGEAAHTLMTIQHPEPEVSP